MRATGAVTARQRPFRGQGPHDGFHAFITFVRRKWASGVYGAGMINVCAAEAAGTEPVAHCGLPVGHDGTHQVYYRDRLLDWPRATSSTGGHRLWQRSPAELVDAR